MWNTRSRTKLRDRTWFPTIQRTPVSGTCPRSNAPTAWNTTTGNSSVIVAILDTGVDPTHPDLASNLVPGWNAYDGNTDTHDVYGHGTSVAGVVAALGNNGLGIASVAWGCRIMPIRISDTTGYGYFSTGASGLAWAADHGARVANISYEFTGSSTVQDAASYFQSKGGVVTISAGNEGTALTIPDSPYVLTVGATDSNDALASFSNTGSVIDLVAPGVNITTTANGGGYTTASGTSFSAPIVVGVAALVLSVNPTLTAPQVQGLLTSSADHLGTAGDNPQFGWCRVDAANAVAQAVSTLPDTQPPSVSFIAPINGAIVGGVVQVQVSASDNRGLFSVSISVDGGAPIALAAPYTFAWNATKVASGSHTLVATAVDTSNNSATAKVTVMVKNPPPDTTPPTVQLIAPLNGAYMNSMVWVAARASDNVGVVEVDLYMNSTLVGTSTSASATYWISTTSWPKGACTLKAEAYDAAGNSAWSAPVTVYTAKPPVPDTTPPTVQITAPAAGILVNSMLWVSASASDNVGVTEVDLYMNGTLVGTSTSASATYWVSTTSWPKGACTLKAEAFDAAGNSAWSSPVAVYTTPPPAPDTTPPTVQLIAPLNGAPMNSMVWVAARASDNVGVVEVDLYMNGTLVGTSTSASATYWISTQTWPKGACVLEAKAYDVAGNFAWSPPVTVYK